MSELEATCPPLSIAESCSGGGEVSLRGTHGARVYDGNLEAAVQGKRFRGIAFIVSYCPVILLQQNLWEAQASPQAAAAVVVAVDRNFMSSGGRQARTPFTVS